MPQGGMSMTLCLDTPHIWGSVDFDAFTSIVLIPEQSPIESTEQFPMYIRGRETGEGETLYGTWYEGWIIFNGGGIIEGCFTSLYAGLAEFVGRREPGSARGGFVTWQLRSEWDNCSSEEYERERVGRWRTM